MSDRKHGPQRDMRTGTLAASIGALIAAGGLSSAVWAQDDEEDEETEQTEQSQDTIVVTGTRIRRDDFSATNSTTVVTADDMRDLGVTSVAEMINQLPNNVAAITPESSANDNFNMGASIANLRGLNTFGGTRTLTLVDNRRFVPSNNGGGVDLNMIPTALVGRIETVTGGASATYGADAMAGVVNVILDENIEGIRADLSYNVTGEGDGENYNLSLGTGFQFFEGRGTLTLGYDHSNQEGIFDCTTRALCRAGRSLIRNGMTPGSGFLGLTPASPYTGPREEVFFDDRPEWVVLEGMQYHMVPEGLLWGLNSPTASPSGYADPGGDLTTGVYRLTPDGTNVEPYLNGLTPEQQQLVYEEGVREDSPWGDGALTYKNLSLLPENSRDNLFTRFSYDFEGGVQLTSSLTLSRSESTSKQNSARQAQYTGCIFPDNAFLDPRSGATDTLRAVFDARRGGNTVAYTGTGAHSLDYSATERGPNLNTANPNDVSNGDGNCRPAPWIGLPRDPTAGGSTVYDPNADEFIVFDFPRNGGTYIHKDFSPFIDRTNFNDTETLNFTLGANGSLFEGGSWTWDAYMNYGKTEREAFIQDWQSDNRLEMALFSVWDDQHGAVCATDERLADTQPDFYNAVRSHWDRFLVEALQDEAWLRDENGNVLYDTNDVPLTDQPVIDAYYANLAFGCAPLNLLGTNPGPSRQALAYAFPEMGEGTENVQRAASISFSGDAWRGFGAGPLRMAGGVDWTENETGNNAGANAYTSRDLQGGQVPAAGGTNLDLYLNFGDNWGGLTKTAEAFVEFELPLLRDKIAADYLMVNIANRRTQNKTTRIEGTQEIDVQTVTRYNDSWKVSMDWQPIDVMRVRMTRSTDTRAPSAQELFQTNSPAVNTGAMSEVLNRNRVPVCEDPDEVYDQLSDDPCPNSEVDTDPQWDLSESFQGGNSNLTSERSITETLGMVFTPARSIPGLSVSVDYYQTLVQGGIENLQRFQTLQGCSSGIGEQVENPATVTAAQLTEYADNVFYCDNVDYGAPDPDGTQRLPNGEINPLSNIQSVATSSQNVAAFLSRGFDVSVSYFTQLDGGGSINTRVLATRFLEQSVDTEGVFGRVNVAGQTGSNGLNRQNFNLGTNYSPTPRISGNMFMTYRKNAFSLTGQLQYVGSGRLYIQEGWIGPGEIGYPNGGGTGGTPYAVDISNTVELAQLPSWSTLNVNFTYDFARSRFNFDRFESLSGYLNIDNVGDRIPDFFSGSGAGGINTTFFSGLGRQYRVGVRMEF